MPDDYDVIIIGAGHNGLVAATVLARAGKRVLVLEQRDVLGGAAASEAVFPGFSVPTGAHDAALFRDEIARELFLPIFGLQFHEPPVVAFCPQPDGSALTLWRDEERTVAALVKRSARDAERYPAFAAEVNRFGRLLGQMMLLPPPELGDLVSRANLNEALSWGRVALQLRRLGERDMMALLRVLPLSVQNYLDDWFESEALKGALGALGIAGSRLGPRAAGTNLLFLYQHARGFPGTRFVIGGMGELAASLARAGGEAGAEIRCGAPVARILVTDEKASGVALADGTTITARAILSNADPRRTLFHLLSPTHLQPRDMRQVRNIVFRGSTAKINLALDALPTFNGQEEVEQLRGHIRISPSLDYLERAADHAKYGRFSSHPYLDVVIPTLTNPTLAPDGAHLLSVTMQYAPYALHTDDWHSARERLGDAVVATLEQVAPGFGSLIRHRQILTPLDWEESYSLSEGSIYHGQMGLDQLLVMRPIPGWSRYRTPLPNLYLCGAGAHPGGGVTGAPGYNAAHVLLNAWDGR